MSYPTSDITYEEHVRYIKIAIELAHHSEKDIPVASLIVHNKQILASAVNQKEKNNDPTAHAEILAIREACHKLQKWRLTDVVLYTTLEPCPMCASAILFSRIPVIVFAAYDNLYGALGSVIDLTKLTNFYKPQIIGGIEEEKSASLLKTFFKNVSENNKYAL